MIVGDDDQLPVAVYEICQPSHTSATKRRNFNMSDIKLQLGCIAIVLFILAVYLFKLIHYKRTIRFSPFLLFFGVGIVTLVFDALTDFTVNHQSAVSHELNLGLHAVFLIGLDTVLFSLFIYMLVTTHLFPQRWWGRALYFVPYLANVAVVIACIEDLEFVQHPFSNYSMGVSAYTCFAMGLIYALAIMVILAVRYSSIETRNRVSLVMCMLMVLISTVVQAIFPYILITSVTVTALILGLYLNQEDPLILELYCLQKEMIMGFATLIESRDESTGEHVRRTSDYVRIILDGLKADKNHRKLITKEFYDYMLLAAPLHDIGKISIPDNILQKKGKLTPQEFEVIKTHTTSGADIIRETFGHTANEKYFDIAYNVALYHHEKYSGTGYPCGKKGKSIPLEARIMAVADVYDAISEKRCYRDALPPDVCFSIILEGRGTDFDPDIVDIFLRNKEKVLGVRGTAAPLPAPEPAAAG